MLVMIVSVALILSLIVLFAAYGLSLKAELDAEKLSPFECGFIPVLSSRNPFSMQFFLISLIFLIFDIELILLFPYMTTLHHKAEAFGALTVWLFISVLSLGLFFEWSQKMLEWYKFK